MVNEEDEEVDEQPVLPRRKQHRRRQRERHREQQRQQQEQQQRQEQQKPCFQDNWQQVAPEVVEKSTQTEVNNDFIEDEENETFYDPNDFPTRFISILITINGLVDDESSAKLDKKFRLRLNNDQLSIRKLIDEVYKKLPLMEKYELLNVKSYDERFKENLEIIDWSETVLDVTRYTFNVRLINKSLRDKV